MSTRGERRARQRRREAERAGQQGLTLEQPEKKKSDGPRFEAWTDGSCLKNPGGPGGWAVVFADGSEASGSEESTTNNRMELQAIIEALAITPEGSIVVVHSDSQLCVHCGNGKWKRRANKDLWATYDGLAQVRTVTLKWVRGHNGHPQNERADFLANSAAMAWGFDEPRLSKLMGESL